MCHPGDEFDQTDDESLEDRFYRLADRWDADPKVLFSSSIAEITQHPDYQAIIAMGQEVVPLILRELVIKPGHWFVALCEITGENPVPEDYRGNLYMMSVCWITWGMAHKLIALDSGIEASIHGSILPPSSKDWPPTWTSVCASIWESAQKKPVD